MSENDNDNLKLLDLSIKSPPILNLEGVDKILKQMFYGKNEETRAQENHDMDIIKKSLENGLYIAQLDDKINGLNLGDEIKSYLKEMLKSTVEKQKRLIGKKEFARVEYFR